MLKIIKRLKVDGLARLPAQVFGFGLIHVEPRHHFIVIFLNINVLYNKIYEINYTYKK